MSKYIKLEDALKEFNYGTDYPVNTIIDILYDLPTIEVSDKADRPQGEWKGHGMFCVQCDQCGKWAECRTSYCANCGARMEDPE